MTLSKQQTLSIVRTLTCALCAAVLAWGGLASNAYADADSISINFGADKGAPTGGNLGVVPVSGANWNNASGASGTIDLKNNTGAVTGVSGTWSSANTWNFNESKPSTNNNGILYYGYLDDGGDNGARASYSMSAPYFSYDIYYYAATDSSGFRYATINSANYCGVNTETRQGINNWGTPVKENIDVLTEGVNYLKVLSSDSIISIVGQNRSGNYRGSFGAVQIVNTANSQSTTTAENSLVLSSSAISWNNDLTGATGQSFDANAFGYRILYTGTEETFTVDLNGATSLPNIKLLGSATNLAFANVTLNQLGETGKVLDLAGTGADVTLPAFTQIAKQGVVKLGSNVTFAETPADTPFITGSYFADSTTSFACIQDGVVKAVDTVTSASDGVNLRVASKIDDKVNNQYVDRTFNSLTTEADYVNSKAVTITSGMMTLQRNNHWVQGGGTITSGYRNSDGEYDLYICGWGDGDDMRIDTSTIIDNPGYNNGETIIPAGKVNVIKTGVGRVSLSKASSTDTYSGKTMVLEGKLQIGEYVRSTDFYVARGAQLDFSSRNYRNDTDFPDFEVTATSLSGYGTVEIGNANGKISMTLNNVANDGSKFARVNAYGKALTMNNSALHAEYVDNNTAITLTNSTLAADTLNGGAASKVTITGNSSLNVGNIAGTVTLEIPENETQTINTAIGGSGELVKAGAGTLELTANNTYSGNTQINGGVLDLTEGKLYSGAYAVADVYVNDGGTLKVNHFGYAADGRGSLGGLTYSSYDSTNFHFNGGTVQITESYGDAINRKIELQTNGGTLDLAEGVELTLGSDVHGSGGLTKAGAGTLTLTEAPGYTGNTTISAGKLVTTAGGTLYNLSGAGTLDNNGQAITLSNSDNTAFTGVITGSGSLTKTGTGKLEISKDINYTGNTSVSEGTLQINGASDGGKRFRGTITIANGAKLICNAHDSLGYSNDYTNVFDIYGTLDNASGNESFSNTTFNLYGGTISSTGGGSLDILAANDKIFTFALDSASATAPTVSTISSNIRLRANNQTLEIDTAANTQLKISGVISASNATQSITKLGAGTLTLSGYNTFTGDTFVNAGTLELTATGGTATLPKGRAVTVDGATSVLAGHGDILGYTSGAIGSLTLQNGGTFKNDAVGTHITVNNPIYMNNGIITAEGAGTDGKFNFYFDNAIHVTGGTDNKITAAGIRLRALDDTHFVEGSNDFAGLIDVAADAKLTISSVIEASSNAALTKSGAGELVLTSASDGFTKGATISQGVLTLEESGTLGTGAVAIAQNAVMNFNHDDDATFNNSVSGVAIDPDDPGSAVGYGTINKNGSGVLKIYNPTPNNFVTDSFVVNAGELDFKGYFKGALEIGEGAVFSPGNSVGDLIQDGTFTLDSGALLLIEQDATGIDTITATSFVLPEDSISLSITSIIPGATYDIIMDSNGFEADQLEESYWLDRLFDLPYYMNLSVVNGDTVRLHIDANSVPEPSTWALLILGVAGLMYLRRRK